MLLNEIGLSYKKCIMTPNIVGGSSNKEMKRVFVFFFFMNKLFQSIRVGKENEVKKKSSVCSAESKISLWTKIRSERVGKGLKRLA